MTQEKPMIWRNTPTGKAYMKQWWLNHKDKVNAGQRQRYHRDVAKQHNRALQRRFGITLADYNQMFTEQQGACYLCKIPSPLTRRLDVDHNHRTGKVRKLLCHQCNKALGTFEKKGVSFTALEEYTH